MLCLTKMLCLINKLIICVNLEKYLRKKQISLLKINMNIKNKQEKNNSYNEIIVNYMRENNLHELNGSVRKGLSLIIFFSSLTNFCPKK